jgi:hypothetical protein
MELMVFRHQPPTTPVRVDSVPRSLLAAPAVLDTYSVAVSMERLVLLAQADEAETPASVMVGTAPVVAAATTAVVAAELVVTAVAVAAVQAGQTP